MPYELRAECPCCNVVAQGSIEEIERVFGFRKMEGGITIPQSYCRRCRGAKCSPGDKKC